MSFSSGVKDELSRHQTLARHCQIAEIAAIGVDEIRAHNRALQAVLRDVPQPLEVSRRCVAALKAELAGT